MTDLVQRAAALRPVLEKGRRSGDQRRRLPDETVDALAGAGLFRALVPRRFGGSGEDLRMVGEATAEVAKGDPSAGWTVMILGSGAWITGLFPQEAQEELYSDGPDTRVCTVLAPRATARRTSGGRLLSGKWAPASGCLHSQWAILGFPLDEGGVGVALVPMAELDVEDTWFTTGMRATGSNLLVGNDITVPEHRVLALGPARDGSLMVPVMAAYMIAPYLGIAEAALEHVLEHGSDRGVAFTKYERKRDSPAFQLAVADAAARIDVVRLLARNSASLVDGHATAGTLPDRLTRARLRMHTGYAAQQCREAVDALVSAFGASALAESSPLEGHLRDVHAATRHAVADPVVCAEIFGRALLGVEPNISDLL